MATAFGGDNAESYYDEGLTASMKGDLRQAAEFFEKALRLDSSMATAYQQLGKCYARLGKHKLAVKLLGEVVRKRPRLIAPRIDLGLALIGLGQFATARQQFQQVLGVDQNNVKALLGVASADFSEGNWNGALANAQTAQMQGGQNFAVHYMLGRAAKLAGDTTLSVKALDQADRMMEKYVEANPDQPEGHFLRAEVAFVRESITAALESYRAAEDKATEGRSYLAYGESFTLVDILVKQGLCLQRLAKKDRAREVGERILELDPDNKIGQSMVQK